MNINKQLEVRWCSGAHLGPQPLGLFHKELGDVGVLGVQQRVEGGLVVPSTAGDPGTLEPALAHLLLTQTPAHTHTHHRKCCYLVLNWS